MSTGTSDAAGVRLIRATHPYAFRSGRWAALVGTVDDPETGCRCYSVLFPDGAADWWPVDDEAHGYEFREAGSRLYVLPDFTGHGPVWVDPEPWSRQVAELGRVIGEALLPAAEEALRNFHDLSAALFPRRHRKCLTCHPGRKPKPLAVDGREYRRRQRARTRRRRR